jgi:HAD superfamily hydrolase (TIGR01509 family)
MACCSCGSLAGTESRALFGGGTSRTCGAARVFHFGASGHRARRAGQTRMSVALRRDGASNLADGAVVTACRATVRLFLLETRVIRNIVFDIGWVLAHLNARPILDFLAAHDTQQSDLDAVTAGDTLTEHESGRLHGDALLERIAKLARKPVTVEQVRVKWLDMFELQPAMVDLAHRLSARYRVYLLSNVGDLHWAHLSREFSLHHIGHGALPSYLAGVMKPHEGIYMEAERRFVMQPAETVFIDDRADNIAAACARGWHGIVHAGYATTTAGLRDLGVEC